MSLKRPGVTGSADTGGYCGAGYGTGWYMTGSRRGSMKAITRAGYPADTCGEQVDEDEQSQVLDLAGDTDQRGEDVKQRETGDQPDPEHGTLS